MMKFHKLIRLRYMLRYLKAVQEMRRIIRENKLTVMATIARYACAYEAIIKPDWWNKELRFVQQLRFKETFKLSATAGGQ
jgi:hypothetical protein